MPTERGSENFKFLFPNLTSLHGLCENTLQKLVRERAILSYRVRCPAIAIPIRHLLDLFGEQCSLLTFLLFDFKAPLFQRTHRWFVCSMRTVCPRVICAGRTSGREHEVRSEWSQIWVVQDPTSGSEAADIMCTPPAIALTQGPASSKKLRNRPSYIKLMRLEIQKANEKLTKNLLKRNN